MGWEGQAKILNAYSHSVPATQSAKAGIEASALLAPKPVNRNLPTLKALGRSGEGFVFRRKALVNQEYMHGHTLICAHTLTCTHTLRQRALQGHLSLLVPKLSALRLSHTCGL